MESFGEGPRNGLCLGLLSHDVIYGAGKKIQLVKRIPTLQPSKSGLWRLLFLITHKYH